jgi:hypothetical protein
MSSQHQQQDETIPVGLGSQKKRDELQTWASYFYGQKSIDPNTGKEVSIIEKPQIGLLIKEATYDFIYQYIFLLSMQDNPKPRQAMETPGQQMQGQQVQTK